MMLARSRNLTETRKTKIPLGKEECKGKEIEREKAVMFCNDSPLTSSALDHFTDKHRITSPKLWANH
jgi:hypothetical protein